MGWECVVDSWFAYLPEFMSDDLKKMLRGLSDWISPAALDFQRRNCKEPSPTIDQTLIISCHRVMQSLHDAFLTAETADAMAVWQVTEGEL